MKRLFLVILFVLLLTGCKKADISYTAEVLENEASLTSVDSVEYLQSYPTADSDTLNATLDFPDIYKEKKYLTVPSYGYGLGEYLPVIRYMDAEGNESVSVFDCNINDLSEGVALYQRAEDKLTLEPSRSFDVVYPDSSFKEYTNTFIYNGDKSKLLYNLVLPFEYCSNEEYRVAKSVYFKESDSCKIKQVLPDDRLLLEFSRNRSKYIAKSNSLYEIVKTPVFYVYDIKSGEYTFISDDADVISVSPDLKCYITQENTDNGKCYYLCRTDSIFRANAICSQDVLTVDWIVRDELYSSIGIDAPLPKYNVIPYGVEADTVDTSASEEAKPTYELNAETENTVHITVGLHKDISNEPFEVPKSCDASEMDFGEYLPYLRGYTDPGGDDYSSSYAALQGAFITQGASSLEEGKAVYSKVNDRYSESDYILLNGKREYLDPLKTDLIIDVSSDMSQVVLHSDGTYKYFLAKEFIKAKSGSVYLEDELLKKDYPEYDVVYSAQGEEIYRDDERVMFSNDSKLFIYSRKTSELLKTVDFKYVGDPLSVGFFEYYVTSSRLLEVIDGRYVFVEYPRYVNHEGDCTCGMRIPDDSALCRYDLLTDEYELIANHYQSYGVSPDGRYVAYTYNTADDLTEGDKWYEYFAGCVCITELESSKTLVLPFEEKSGFEFTLPSTIWSVGEWVETAKLNEVLSQPANDFKIYEGVVLSAPETVVSHRLDLNNSNSASTESIGNVSFGDYLPMIRYPLYENGSIIDYQYAILTDGTNATEDGIELYEKINNKYSEGFPMADDVTASSSNDILGRKLFSSRLVYLSTSLDTAVLQSYKDLGRKGESTNWKDHKWSTEYKTVNRGEAVRVETEDGISDSLYTEDTDKSYDKAYRLERNGATYAETCRNANWAVFRINDYSKITFYVYSIKDGRFTCTLVYDDPNLYDVSIDNISEDGRYFTINKRGYVYLYDLQNDKYHYIGETDSYLFSPDMKYVIFNKPYTISSSDGSVQFDILVRNIEKNELYSLKTPFVKLSERKGVYTYNTVDVISWIDKSALATSLE